MSDFDKYIDKIVSAAVSSHKFANENSGSFRSSVMPSPPTSFCYNIGDITPTGGMVFALPFTGVNQTNFYYEVALEDVADGGTPTAGFNIQCGAEQSLTTQLLIPPHQGPCPPFGAAYGFVPSGITAQLATGMLVDFPYLPTGATIASINSTTDEVGFSGGNVFDFTTHPLGPFTPPLCPNFPANGIKETITFTPQPLAGFSLSGAEFGVHFLDNLPLSEDFGMGANNTDFLHTHPITPGVHPYLQQHHIAATLCTDFQSISVNPPNDWFLPSFGEFSEMLQQVGPATAFGSTLNLQTDTEDSKNWYWTSSVVNDTWLGGLPPFPPDWLIQFSWAFSSTTSLMGVPQGPWLVKRCHALSVRPIRRFECEPSNCGCACVEYNYRDGHCGNFHGSFCSGTYIDFSTSPIGVPGWGTNDVFDHWGSIQSGVPVLLPWNSPILLETYGFNGDNVIGMGSISVSMASVDVKGNEYTINDIQNHDANGYTVTLWDSHFNLIGKWRYASYVFAFFPYSMDEASMADPSIPHQHTVLMLEGPVTHLEGPHPWVYYGLKSILGTTAHSVTGSYMKIEWLGQGGQPYEIGCNSSVFGGEQDINNPAASNPPWDHSKYSMNFPAYCGEVHPLKFSMAPWEITDPTTAIPRYATFELIDHNNIQQSVSPTLWDAQPALLTSTAYLTGGPGSFWYFPNEHTHPEECPCRQYNIGDTGPAGGIIVAVPYMNINDPINGIVGPQIQPIQGDWVKNPTNFYFEISPQNLNNPLPSGGPAAQWGNIPKSLNPTAPPAAKLPDCGAQSDYWDVENNLYLGAVNLNNTFGVPGTGISNIYTGEGRSNYQWLKNNIGIAMGGVLLWDTGSTYQNTFSAVNLVNDYNTQTFLNCSTPFIGCDWFLPTTMEMDFARNYTQPGTLSDTTGGVNSPNNVWSGAMYWTSNAPNMDISMTCFNHAGLTATNSPIWGSAYVNYQDDEVAMVVPASPSVVGGQFEGFVALRQEHHNVRAMRRFECGVHTAPPVAPSSSEKLSQPFNPIGIKTFNIDGEIEYIYEDFDDAEQVIYDVDKTDTPPETIEPIPTPTPTPTPRPDIEPPEPTGY